MVAGGKIDIYDLKGLPTADVRKELLMFPGVGRKVADCIMLYSMRKFDAFPIDVWIKRVLEHIYFDGSQMPLANFKNLPKRGLMIGPVLCNNIYFTTLEVVGQICKDRYKILKV